MLFQLDCFSIVLTFIVIVLSSCFSLSFPSSPSFSLHHLFIFCVQELETARSLALSALGSQWHGFTSDFFHDIFMMFSWHFHDIFPEFQYWLSDRTPLMSQLFLQINYCLCVRLFKIFSAIFWPFRLLFQLLVFLLVCFNTSDNYFHSPVHFVPAPFDVFRLRGCVYILCSLSNSKFSFI